MRIDDHIYVAKRIHHLDPRMKLVVSLLIVFVIAFSSNYSTSFLALLVALVAVLIGQLPVKTVAKRLFFANGFIIFIWFVLPLTTPGDALLTWRELSVSHAGVMKSLLITLKMNSILLLLLTFVSTIPIVIIGQALQKMCVNHKLVFLFLFVFRYINLLSQEYHAMLRAAKMRGFKGKTQVASYKTYGNLIGMLLVRSYERAERIYRAMLCRGFNGTFYSLTSMKFGMNDIVFLMVSLIFLAALLSVEFYGFA